jgi:hypothetical protein
VAGGCAQVVVAQHPCCGELPADPAAVVCCCCCRRLLPPGGSRQTSSRTLATMMHSTCLEACRGNGRCNVHQAVTVSPLEGSYCAVSLPALALGTVTLWSTGGICHMQCLMRVTLGLPRELAVLPQGKSLKLAGTGSNSLLGQVPNPFVGSCECLSTNPCSALDVHHFFAA